MCEWTRLSRYVEYQEGWIHVELFKIFCSITSLLPAKNINSLFNRVLFDVYEILGRKIEGLQTQVIILLMFYVFRVIGDSWLLLFCIARRKAYMAESALTEAFNYEDTLTLHK